MNKLRDKARRAAAAREESGAPSSAPDKSARLLEEVSRLSRLAEEHAQERISLQALIDAVPDYLWVKDIDSNFIVANKAVLDDNRTPERDSLIGVNDFALHPRERAQKFFDAEQHVVKTGESVVDLEEMILTTEGFNRWLLTTKTPLRNQNGEIIGVVGISRDITARKRAEALRAGEAQILEMIAKNAPLEDVLDQLMRVAEAQLDGIFCSTLLLDEDGVHLRDGAGPSLDPAYRRAIDGIRIGPSVGSCGTAMYRREPVIVTDIYDDPLWADFRGLVSPYGYRSCWSTPILSHQGEPLGAFALYSKEARAPESDEQCLVATAARLAGIAIERKRAEERIHYMANHDSLTGLPNRTLLKDRLHQSMLFADKYNRWAILALIDLDNFKLINDSLGHGAGDELLRIVAKRMVERLKPTDTVVRLGANEFAVMIADQPKDVDRVTATLQDLRAAIAAPIDILGHALQVASSIGVAIYPKDGGDVEELLSNAGSAMYRAKETGRDNFQFYIPALNGKVHEKFLLQEELRKALQREEFLLLYQPQVDLRSGRIFAVEALIRWRHPEMGLVPPDKFIPAAEESGLIVPIGDWVLREAARQNRAWQAAGLTPIVVSVNVSARQFKERNWVGRVVEALHESGLDAKYLELELTESLIMQDVEQAIATMKQLQGLGVRLSIDDFGTGYSSLSALKSFPVARLKIDKSFVRDLAHDENDRAVATAVISLGQKLNLRVIAEGVETDAQLAFLRDNNCDEMQGYLFSKPAPPEDIAAMLKRPTRWRRFAERLAS